MEDISRERHELQETGREGSIAKLNPRANALILSLVFVSCALSLRPQTTVSSALPILELPDQNGQQQRLADYRGQIVVLNFWATWCAPCAAEMPIFARAWQRFRDQGVVVLAASLDSEETQRHIPEFMRKYKMDFPVLTGASAEHLGEFGLGEAVPATAFIDGQGRVVFQIVGQAHKREVFERIEWMLGSRSGEAPRPLINNVPGPR